MTFSTPILIIFYSRPNLLLKQIDILRTIQPKNLFFASDGFPHGNSELAERVMQCRSLVAEYIDWPCDIKLLYSDVNKGCRVGVSSAIDWFFMFNEEGIILEDDCIPHIEFFGYCEKLLFRYREDTRIWSICGSNFQRSNIRGDASYYFSIYGDSWGWATWKRAWRHYHSAESNWRTFKSERRLNDVFYNFIERCYWTSILDRLFDYGVPSAWDYQWWCAGWMNHALHIWPNKNLISNQGFDSRASNTLKPTSFANLPLESLGSIVHPKFILPHLEADRYAFFHRRRGYVYALKLVFRPLSRLLNLAVKQIKP